MAHKLFLGILIISSFVSNILAEDPQCSNGWEPYKKNCVKIDDPDNTVNFPKAKEACSGISLLTIHSEEEQNLITDFLFKKNHVVNNVWLGIEKNGNSFEWSDHIKLNYTNWLTGNLSQNSDRGCFQMLADSDPPGKWSGSSCDKKNFAVCQGPPLTLGSLQKMISVPLQALRNYLMSDKWMKFEFFKDTKGEQKAFFIPIKEFDKPKSWDDAEKACKEAHDDATIVDADTHVKKFLLFSYLNQLGSSQKTIKNYIWLNGFQNSPGNWIWRSSQNDVSELNWESTTTPNTTDGSDYLGMYIKSDKFGKIINKKKLKRIMLSAKCL